MQYCIDITVLSDSHSTSTRCQDTVIV